MWTRPETMEAVLKLTPSIQHLELCAGPLSPAIDTAPFLDVAQRHAPHLTTLILRNVPTTFGRLSSLMLRNLEVRVNTTQLQSSGQRMVAFWQLVENTPSLERLILHDWAAIDGAETPYPHELASPKLLRLRCFYLETWSAILASTYLGLASRSNLRELSLKLEPSSPRSHLWNAEHLRAWPQLKILSLPHWIDINPGVLKTLSAVEELESDKDTFLYLVTLASGGTTLLASLETLRIRMGRRNQPDGLQGIAAFLRAREAAGIPLRRLLIHEDDLEAFLSQEHDLQGINVQIGRYTPSNGFEGVTAALEPVDVLFSDAELKEYGLRSEPEPKSKPKRNRRSGVSRTIPTRFALTVDFE
ncbi:hypothetical protein CALVIDRAFT_68054 [Calocera viscosa TUFC12733]|uniref:F-box domain-containing protein n=1 Tax=Calocera viscosa (strain TUFC12733) TaxID=1330018 RepID=A0A167N8E0_CALVF|nr:hypothetical protein CALVIDRAFT_68054 [Calocera viscosa TUFC12733]